jgi:lysophospholipase L1-like esterase
MTTPAERLAILSNEDYQDSVFSRTSGIYFASAYGLEEDGVSDDYTSFYALINDVIDGDDAEIWINGTCLIGTNITIPSNIKLKFLNGGMLKPASGVTITGSNAKIDAGLTQIFDLSLGGTVAGTWDIDKLLADWFGLVGDGTTDDTTVAQKVVNIATALSKDEVYFIDGRTYKITSLTGTSGMNFYGSNVTITGGSTITVTNLHLHSEVAATTSTLGHVILQSTVDSSEAKALTPKALNDYNGTVTAALALKASTDYVDSQIASVGSGSPVGVYATLVALEAAYPTGTTGIYVVVDDGEWYYWDGAAWTSGGVYQSTAIPDGSVTDAMMENPKPTYDDTTGEMMDAYTAHQTYQHARGDGELAGNATYTVALITFYEQLEKGAIINRIELPVYNTSASVSFSWKLYIRDSATAFKPNDVTPDDSGTLSTSETNHSASTLQSITLSDLLYVEKDKYLFVSITSNISAPVFPRWTANSIAEPYRHTFWYSTDKTGATTLTESNPSGYLQATMKAFYEIPDDMLQEDYATSAELALKADQTDVDLKAYIANVSQITNMNYDLALPAKIYALVGETINIYFDNLISTNNKEYYVSMSSSKGTQWKNRWEYTPSVAESFSITINIYDRYLNLVSTGTSTVTAVDTSANSGVNKTCLFIGDSHTSRNTFLSELYTNLMGPDVMNMSLIGTAGTAPIKHEGYSGRTVYWHYTDAASPFVFGGTFNFSQYMSTNGFASVDVVVIMLGTNDTSSLTSDAQVVTAIANNKTYLDAMISSIKAFNANVKIGIALTFPPSDSQDAVGYDYACARTQWRYKRNFHQYSKGIITNYGGKEISDNIYLISTNLNLDTVNNMVVTTAALNSRNSTTYSRQSDTVHPAASGYYQIADAIYYWLKNL